MSSRRTIGSYSAAAFMLLIGGCFYLLMRPPYLLIHKVAWNLGFGIVVQHGRMLVAGIKVPDWMLYSVPGALWSAAYIIIVDKILYDSRMGQRLAVASFIPVLGAGSELLQRLHMIPGTFDAIDIVAYAVPYIIFVIYEITHNTNIV